MSANAEQSSSEKGTTEVASDGTSDKSLEMMRKFSEQYVKRTGTYFCVDKGVTAVVIKVRVLRAGSCGCCCCCCG